MRFYLKFINSELVQDENHNLMQRVTFEPVILTRERWLELASLTNQEFEIEVVNADASKPKD